MSGRPTELSDTVNSRARRESEEPDQRLLVIVMAGADVGQIFTLGDKAVYLIGRDERADILLTDGEISRRHAALRFDQAKNVYLLADLNSRNGTRLNGVSCQGELVVTIGDKIQLGSQNVLRVSNASEDEARYAQQMQHAVLRDALTGIFNRRYLDDRLVGEMAFAKRHGTPLSVLLADIDHFKRINDSIGHLGGDAVLCRFAQVIQEKVRTEDVVARYGGEEFAVVCRNTDEGRAAILAERLRRAVESTTFSYEKHNLPVTVSIGVAGMAESKAATPEGLLAAADAALYRAKEEGRNRWRASTG